MWLGRTILKGAKRWPGTYWFSSKKKDLYEILGVSRTATQNDIKKAYFKLAQTHHPDKNPSPDAKDKFAQINNAYETLSDSNKRQMYDQTGSTQDNPYAGFENEDIFNAFRGGFGGGRRGNVNQDDINSMFEDIFGGAFGGGNRRGRRRGGFEQGVGDEDIVVKVQLDFNQAVNGTSKTLEYPKRSTCGTCKGSKAKPGTKPQKCQSCHGTGFMTFQQGIMMMRMECERCHGQGNIISTPCTTCQGQGVQNIKTREEIKFPRGIDNNAQLKFRGKGHQSGDLIVQVVVKSHPKFVRQGNDVIYQQELPVIDAILGIQIPVPTIYGQSKKLKIPAGTQNGEKIKMNRQGFYRLNSTDKGNQVVVIKIKIPSKLTDEESDLYRKLREIAK